METGKNRAPVFQAANTIVIDLILRELDSGTTRSTKTAARSHQALLRHVDVRGTSARRFSTTPQAGFVLDALEQAVHDRRPIKGKGVVHHSHRGSQYLSVKYTERLAEAGIAPSVGNVCDSYDNAQAETINSLFKAELIHRPGPWRRYEVVDTQPSNG